MHRAVPTLMLLGLLCLAAAAFQGVGDTAYLPLVVKSGDAARPWPDTSKGVHVFNDQLASGLSEAQWRFAATHYAGTQKMVRSDARRLRAVNPDFIILHYRLGHALGYRAIQGGCQPTGDWLYIISGDTWVREWPGDAAVNESWLYHWPEASDTRVLNCDWGWHLAELDNPGWRTWWQEQVLGQLRANEDDGLFMDSLSVPNYLGADRYLPALPDVDVTFENDWAGRIERWLAWLQTQPVGDYYLVPNVGSWITTRDPTDYGSVDGVMIEGFAIEANGSPYSLADWQLQMNRALELIVKHKTVIGQSYVTAERERLFALGSYLLIKGRHTFLNTETDMEPEWWPEYDIPIGAPTQDAGSDIGNLYVPARGVYQRPFDNGLVLVNPTNPWDGSGATVSVALGDTYYRAQPTGGGRVPPDGIPTGSLDYTPCTSVTLPPYSAAVLLTAHP